MINKIGSLPSDIDFKAETAIAGAVFLLIGSRRIEPGFTFICLSCSAVINLCSSLHITIGCSEFFNSLILLIVICRNEEFLLLLIDRYCLGKLLLESGQSLVPDPPQRIIGSNLLSLAKVFISKNKFYNNTLNTLYY